MAKKKSTSVARKATRAKSWAKAQERKAADILEQEENTKTNAQYRARGERTPAQQRKRDAFMARISTG